VKKRFVLVMISLTSGLLLLAGMPVHANDEAEQTAKTLCAGCHGPAGISTNDLWPNLAGQKAGYTAQQLKAYRDATRVDVNMNGLVQNFTDEQIAALAAYYAKL
jgi:cytochrome c553